MSASLEIGNRSGEIVIIVPSGFIDDVFDVIKRDLPFDRRSIIENLIDGYAESTYFDLSSINAESFQEVKSILLVHHRKHLEDQVKLTGEFSSSRTELMNSLKTGLLIDERGPHLDEVLLKTKIGEIQVQRWWFQFVLEALVVLIEDADHKRQIYDLWLQNRNMCELEPLMDIFAENLDQVKLQNICNPYLKEKHEKYLKELSRLIGYSPEESF